jgi:cyanate permease
MTDERLEETLAREQIRAISGFYNHFVAFVAVMAILVGINLATGDAFWVHWVVFGWGLGVLFHAFLVFVRKPQRLAEMRARHARSALEA